MAHRNELKIGVNPLLNNMTCYRKVGNLPFLPQYYFDNNDDISIEQSSIEVNYIEYYKNSNSEIINELTKTKSYIVKGQKAVAWFLQLARTPINNIDGIMDSIETTLLNLPVNIPNGYIII